LRGRTLAALRPSVESLLVAAVALGCAQAGWSLLAPRSADASGAAAGSPAGSPLASAAEATSETPFAPFAKGGETSSYAINSVLANLAVVGVRMAEEPTASGAILAVAEGAQVAFQVGDEVAPGVRLAAVEPRAVVLAFSGGERVVEMAGFGGGFSYANALLGRMDPSLGDAEIGSAAPAKIAALADAAARDIPLADVSAPDDAAMPMAVSAAGRGPRAPVPGLALNKPETLAWLTATLSRRAPALEGEGWLVAAPPEDAAAIGLAAGDVIVAVNGAAPGDVAALAEVAAADQIVLTVERDGAPLTLTVPGARP
jgi:general secretion pathway protein C